MSWWSLHRLMTRDPVARVSLVVYLLAFLSVLLAERTSLSAATSLVPLADPLVLGMTVVALLWGRSALARPRERHFWELLALAWGSWLVVDFVFYFDAAIPIPSASLLADVLFVLFYLNVALAVELKPHQRLSGLASQERRWLEAIAGLVAVFGLLVYFALVVQPEPVGLSLSFVSREAGVVANLLMRLSLDVLLLGRLLFAASVADGRWPRLYRLLALAMLGFAARDTVLLVFPGGLGAVWNASLYLPSFLVILAARYRHLPFAESPGGEVDSPEPVSVREVRNSPLALYVLVVPVIHLALYPQDLLEDASRSARDVFSLIYLLIVGLIVARYQVTTDRDRRRAIRSLEVEIEERERLYRELETRQAELERFTYTISHELRAPLVTIHGFTDVLEHRIARQENAAASLDRIRRATKDMNRLLTELLELSRVGWVLDRRREVSVESVAKRVRAKVVSPGGIASPQIQIQRGMPPVDADEARLEDVLTNLVTNAIKFTAAGERARILIGCRDEEALPVYFVGDRGRGIPAGDRERVFGLFNRLDHPEIEGTGVGLALVKRIIEKHEGTVWVESEGAGLGATFCFTIPPRQG